MPAHMTCPDHGWNLPCVRCLFDTRNRVDSWWTLGGIGGRARPSQIRLRTKRRPMLIGLPRANPDYAVRGETDAREIEGAATPHASR